MTLLTLCNLYELLTSRDIAVNRTWQLVGTEMTKASWGVDLVFEDPGGGIEGANPNFHLQAGGTNPARHYGKIISEREITKRLCILIPA